MTVIIVAHIFTLLSLFVVSFQLALIIGKPWGHLTLGGKYPGIIPPQKRWIPFLSILILLFFSLIVEVRAGVIFPEWHAASYTAIWFVVGYCILGVLANTFTPSKWERIIWLPTILAAFVCSIIVAMS